MSHALQVRCLLISQLRDLFISTSGIAGVLLYSKTRYELPDQPSPKGMELQTGRVQRSVRSETRNCRPTGTVIFAIMVSLHEQTAHTTCFAVSEAVHQNVTLHYLL